MFEDDGAGLLPDQLKAAAVRKQIVTAEEAAAMDTRAAMALIFRPGFSTQEHVSMDAGRGVGMDVVAKSVYAIGGKIGVTTNPGKFTRFKVSLPASRGGEHCRRLMEASAPDSSGRKSTSMKATHERNAPMEPDAPTSS